MRWSFGPDFWALAALSAAAAILYSFAFLSRPPSLLRAAIKALAAGAAAAAFASAGAFALTLALGAAAIGDFLFGFNRAWTKSLGGVFFLLTQLFYLAALTPFWIFAGDLSPLWPRYAAIALIVACVLVTLIWIAPKLRWAALIVIPYAPLLTLVCMTAMWQDWRGWPVIIGAALWLTSHILFATDQFRPLPFQRSRQSAWWTYVGAHVLMATGLALASPYMN